MIGPVLHMHMALGHTGRRSTAFIYRAQVLDRTLQILDILAESDEELGPAELAGRLSLHRSTVHRLLMILEHHRIIRRSATKGKYGLGLRLFELGTRAVAQLKLAKRAEPFLSKLAKESGETSHVAVLSGIHVLSVANVEGGNVLQMQSAVGRQAPLHCTAVGKALIAFLPEPTLDELLRRLTLTSYTKRTIRTPDSLRAELARIQVRGFAIDDEELEPGLRCIAAPVRNYSGRVIAAMGIAGPVFRVTKSAVPRLARTIVAAARTLSADLGYKDTPSEAPARLRKGRRVNHER